MPSRYNILLHGELSKVQDIVDEGNLNQAEVCAVLSNIIRNILDVKGSLHTHIDFVNH